MTQSLHDDLHAQPLRDPRAFWAAAAEALHWDRRWDSVLDDSTAPMYLDHRVGVRG